MPRVCILTFTAEGTHAWDDQKSKNTPWFFPAPTRQLHLTVMKFQRQETSDTISSCWALPFLRTSATNLLNQHNPDVFRFFSPFCDYFQWVKTQEVLHIFNSPGRLAAWPPAAIPFHLLSLVLTLNVRIIRGASSGLYFCSAAITDPCLFPQTFFFPVLSRNLLKLHKNFQIYGLSSASVKHNHL